MQIDQILEGLPIPLSIVDKQGNTLLENRHFLELFGYSAKEAPTVEAFLTLACPDEAYRNEISREYFTRVEKALSGEQFEPLEGQVVCGDGRLRKVEFRLVVVDDSLVGVWVDLTDHKRIEEAVRRLLESCSHKVGEEFFQSIALSLAEVLGADYTHIGQLKGEEEDLSIETIAAVADGKPRSGFRYNLAGTPCENIVGQQTCSHPCGVADMFPEDVGLKKLSVEAYVGTPLFDASGTPTGILVAMYKLPITTESFHELILKIFSARIGSELERMEAEKKVQDRVDELQRWHEVTLGREERIHELKTEVNQLLAELGRDKRYQH